MQFPLCHAAFPLKDRTGSGAPRLAPALEDQVNSHGLTEPATAERLRATINSKKSPGADQRSHAEWLRSTAALSTPSEFFLGFEQRTYVLDIRLYVIDSDVAIAAGEVAVIIWCWELHCNLGN